MSALGDPKNLEARRRIFSLIKSSPGIHLRELLRRLHMSAGHVNQHILSLERINAVRPEKYGGYTRFYPIGMGLREKDILAALREKSRRRIIISILSNPDISHEDLEKNLGLSPATISWHLKKLEESFIISIIKKGRNVAFSINDEDAVLKVIVAYRESFMDELVDNVIELWGI